MARAAVFLYGVFAYLLFLASFLYAIAFVGNLGIPKSIDVGPIESLSKAAAIDLIVLSLFAIQHSVMARRGFKRWWTRIVPRPAERSTYVLISSLLLLLLFWQWRPIPKPVWAVMAPAVQVLLNALFWLGWLIVLLSTFMIDHFDLFGLRQVYFYLRNREYSKIGFRSTGFYRYVRHPIMTGFIIAFWATPTMTAGHLIFALATTGYIVIGITLEERDLVRSFGDTYRAYRKLVWSLIPIGLLRRGPKADGGIGR